jgi:hypothetical protein
VALLTFGALSRSVLAQDTQPLPPQPSETGGPYTRDYGPTDIQDVSDPALIFFPPLPPPLDEPPPWPGSRQTVSAVSTPMPSPAGRGSLPVGFRRRFVRSTAPPEELAQDVNEPFYAPLSSLLVKNELRAGGRVRLEQYHAVRAGLVAELQQEMARAAGSDASARERALADFARRQSARLAGFEEEGEALRADLVSSFYGWFVLRHWHLGERAHTDTPETIAAVTRAYASYQNELRPEVRGLLREIAIETVDAPSEPESAVATPAFFFAPETARVRLPADLPAPIAARFAEYSAKKTLLKNSLRNAVLRQEKTSFWRGNLLRKWQEQQSGALVELENLAATIRHELVAFPGVMDARVDSSLPAHLTDRFAALRRELNELQGKTRREIAEVERGIPNLSNSSVMNPPGPPIPLVIVNAEFETRVSSFAVKGLTFEVRPNVVTRVSTPPQQRPARPLDGQAERSLEQTQEAMNAIAAEYDRVFSAIVNEMAALSAELLNTTQPAPDPSASDAPLAALAEHQAAQERALNTLNRHVDTLEKPAAYAEYRAAMFEPGLSPAQRRLLFGQAFRSLGLPLPSGELQPTLRDR